MVGDVRQHQAVDAGRPYQQLQEAGMATARLDTIVRQRDPALRAVVEQLARGEVAGAIRRLETQGRVHAIADPQARVEAVARACLRHPDHTLVVAPDNRSRADLNEVIHHRRQSAGQVAHVEYDARVLVPRQDLTGADRQWAARYQTGDIVRYTKGSQTHGLDQGDYARVVHVDADTNRLTVRPMHGARVTYDPRRLQGVTVYREAQRAFATGDRVQFTAPDRNRQIANRELGTIARMDRGGHVQVRLDSGRTVAFALKAQPHLDFGYAVTSHSSQGQTSDRVLVHIDTNHAGAQLINQRLAYVAISRGRHDAQIYTNDTAELVHALSRDISHGSALEPTRTASGPSASVDPAVARHRAVEQTRGQGFER
jgi:ATP-dependent exoDNAse (exonuclease V) alpha subunit